MHYFLYNYYIYLRMYLFLIDALLKRLFYIIFLSFFFPPQKEPKSANVLALYLWNMC